MAAIVVGNAQPLHLPAADIPRVNAPEAQNDDNCFCLEDRVPANLITTYCGHKFHPDCIRDWIQQNDTCPVCRIPKPLSPITWLKCSKPVIHFQRFIHSTRFTISRFAHSILISSGQAIRNHFNQPHENNLKSTLAYIALSGCAYNILYKAHEESFLTIFKLLGCAFLAKTIRAKYIQMKPASLETKAITYRVLPDAIHSLGMSTLVGELCKFICSFSATSFYESYLGYFLVGATASHIFYSDAANKTIEPLSNKEVKIMDASMKSAQDVAADITSCGAAGALTGYFLGLGTAALITPSLIIGGLYSIHEHLYPIIRVSYDEPEIAPPEPLPLIPLSIWARALQVVRNIASEIFPSSNVRRQAENRRIIYSPNLNKSSTWLTLGALFAISIAISYSIPKAFTNWSIIPVIGYPFYIAHRQP